MKLPIYQVDAFASEVFSGNPAAVCPLDYWLDDDKMQAIAAENNLSETAFFVPYDDHFHIRWFTPRREVRLCGHATLAAAWVLFTEMHYAQQTLRFESQSGVLSVSRRQDLLVMDFPLQDPVPCPVPLALERAFARRATACLRAEDYILVFDDEDFVRNAEVQLEPLRSLDLWGVAITAASREYDFVSRFFAPNAGIDEDPVTGSSFTELAPYWAKQLQRRSMIARQVSGRGGVVELELSDERINIAGKACTYLSGTITVQA